MAHMPSLLGVLFPSKSAQAPWGPAICMQSADCLFTSLVSVSFKSVGSPQWLAALPCPLLRMWAPAFLQNYLVSHFGCHGFVV